MNNPNIFPYIVNGVQRYADPFSVENVLDLYMDHDQAGYRARAESGIAEEAAPSIKRIAEGVAAAFELPFFSVETGQGVGQEDLSRLFNEWLDWNAALKKNSGTSLISPPPSALAPSLSASDWSQVFKSLMDCGCTGSASPTSAPSP
ncbi:MAG TPA: hypothetical protein VG099_24680 [Gemmataceae bacterium]|jgi:hypothetical protein|nr:hypothetical protein [Gemmataceae bacterium]